MTTLIDTAMPAEDYIEGILQSQALSGRTEEAFVSSYLDSLSANLSQNPAQYRAFGPWWPQMKSLIIEKVPAADLGQSIDAGVSAIYNLSRPALTIIAAHLYNAERVESGGIYSAYHELSVHDDADDTEPYAYISADEEMEKLIAIRG